jgi:hypothetical protein
MDYRNSPIAKFVLSPDRSDPVPSIGELNSLTFNHLSAKRGVGQKDIPDMIISKKVVLSPPQTEFKVQNYPLKRMQRGMSGWDWQTEASDEYDLYDRASNCRPTHSTFSKLFPSRNLNVGSYSSRQASKLEESPPPVTEFNRKHDRMTIYRESMLKAQQLFKIQ